MTRMLLLLVAGFSLVMAGRPVVAHHSETAMRLDQARQGHRDDHESRVAEPACLVLCRCEGRRRQSHHVGLLQCAARSADAQGITKDALKIGAEVTVEGVRARDGSNNLRPARDLRRRHERLYGHGGRKMSRRWIASAALAAALVFTGGRQMSAQDVPRMANGKRISPACTPPSTVKGTGPRGNLIFNADKMAPVKPGAESLLYRPRTGDARLDEPRAMCLPAGFRRGMLYILPIRIVQNPKHIVIIPELQRAARIIPTDGRAHRKGIEPSYTAIQSAGGTETHSSSRPSTSSRGSWTITTTRIRPRAAGTPMRFAPPNI